MRRRDAMLHVIALVNVSKLYRVLALPGYRTCLCEPKSKMMNYEIISSFLMKSNRKKL